MFQRIGPLTDIGDSEVFKNGRGNEKFIQEKIVA